MNTVLSPHPWFLLPDVRAYEIKDLRRRRDTS
jgi:hypothetical protein